MLSAFFFVVWIVLMPIKCCCPGGCIIGLLEWVFSTLVMLPVNIANVRATCSNAMREPARFATVLYVLHLCSPSL